MIVQIHNLFTRNTLDWPSAGGAAAVNGEQQKAVRDWRCEVRLEAAQLYPGDQVPHGAAPTVRQPKVAAPLHRHLRPWAVTVSCIYQLSDGHRRQQIVLKPESTEIFTNV